MIASSACTTSGWTPNQLSFDVFGDPYVLSILETTWSNLLHSRQCGTMAVTINNGTAPYKFQAIVGDVRAHDWFVRLYTQVPSSEHQKQPTGHQVKWFVARVVV